MMSMLITLAVVVLLGAGVARAAIRSRRDDENRIRLWADRQGYATLDIRPAGAIESKTALLSRACPGRGIFGRLGCRTYKVFVQDDQGGQFHVLVTLRRSQPPEIRRL